MTTKIPGGMVTCPECRGRGFRDASRSGEYGWHSCCRCDELGYVTKAGDYDRLRADAEAYAEYLEGRIETLEAIATRLREEHSRLPSRASASPADTEEIPL